MIYKCAKCGYDYSGSGDSAHVCGPVEVKGYSKTKTQWEVKFEGSFAPMVIGADSFLDAVEQAKKISDKIVYIQYLCY